MQCYIVYYLNVLREIFTSVHIGLNPIAEVKLKNSQI